MCDKCKKKCTLTCKEKQVKAASNCSNPRYKSKGDNFNLFGTGRTRYGSECGIGVNSRSRYADEENRGFGYGCVNGTGCTSVDSTSVTDPCYRFSNKEFFKPSWCRKNNISGN